MPECDRCPSTFRVELCAVHEDSVRGRIEANLCYKCRQETPHRKLGGEA